MRIYFPVTATLFISVLSGCASAPQQSKTQVPNYLSAEKSCAVVFKGLPAADTEISTERMKAAQFWSRINALLTDSLFTRLDKDYRVQKYENAFREVNVATENIGRALNERKCNRVIQIKHNIDQDAAGPYFEFQLVIMRAQPSIVNGNYAGFKLHSAYEKRYRYTRNPQNIQKFMDSPIDQFINRIVAEAQQSGELTQIQK